MEQNDRRDQNRKLIGVIIVFLAVCVIVTVLILNINREPDPDDDSVETDSSMVEENHLDIENFAYENYPITSLLPIIDDSSGYCLSYDVSTTSDGNYRFVLTVDYKTEEGKQAAENLLRSPDLSFYDPYQYEIVYTKVEDAD